MSKKLVVVQNLHHKNRMGIGNRRRGELEPP